MCAYYPESKVEISKLTAKYYDKLMDIITFGGYSLFIQEAIQLMNIKSNDKIIDLGAGTGRNACLMMNYLSNKGELIGLDISSEMVTQFERKCASFANIKIINQGIDEPLPYENKFDKVFYLFCIAWISAGCQKTNHQKCLFI